MKTWANAKIKLTRMAIKIFGRSSAGLTLVTTRGLTSGIMLDYIYRNQPQGRFIIGKWIDRYYLSHPGWQDVRIRKANLEKYLLAAFDEQKWLGRRPVILDVAAGAGRYVMDVMERENECQPRAVCRDLDIEVLDLGERNAAERGIRNIKFETGDALSAESLSSLDPKPNIVISSGFYDWLNEDKTVKKSMALIFDLLPPGGNFVFTNQCHHVNQEFAEAVFSDLRLQPLRMTMRPAETVNDWAKEAGFTIVGGTGDEKTNYSVTLTRKP
jgi:SAM-dependent methyltransferase